MRFSRLALATAVSTAVLSTAILFTSVLPAHSGVLAAASQAAPAAAPQTPPPPHEHEMPAPTNLKVLPRNLSGPQIHEIMEKWEGELGTGCKTCHTVDPKKLGPNGKPVMNFADDSKEEKRTARVMVQMVENINANYIAKIDSSGAPVTCGTCHRGHLGPEDFVPAPKEHAH